MPDKMQCVGLVRRGGQDAVEQSLGVLDSRPSCSYSSAMRKHLAKRHAVPSLARRRASI